MATKPKENEIVTVDSIKAVNTMDAKEYMEWLGSEGVVVEEFDGGSDWDLVGDKADLIGIPFVIAMTRFNDVKNKKGESTGKQFVSVCCFKEDGTKIVFNDGSTGVMKQLITYADKHKRTTGIMCKKGLRVSEYEYTDKDTGEVTDAKTYYIA
jgi:hypothetical protein